MSSKCFGPAGPFTRSQTQYNKMHKRFSSDIFLVLCLTLDNEPVGPKHAGDIKRQLGVFPTTVYFVGSLIFSDGIRNT
jgi:hypothetical protein